MTTALAINLAGPEEWPDGQARILDTDLATLAGMGQPRDIRKVIKGYEESGDLGQVSQRATIARYENRPGIWQEREVIAYYLDEEQALFVLAKLETPPAKAVTRGVIAAFVAMRRGEASLAVVAPANDTSATLASILKSLDMSARQTERGGRRPRAGRRGQLLALVVDGHRRHRRHRRHASGPGGGQVEGPAGGRRLLDLVVDGGQLWLGRAGPVGGAGEPLGALRVEAGV